jgi:hypothetical protein
VHFDKKTFPKVIKNATAKVSNVDCLINLIKNLQFRNLVFLKEYYLRKELAKKVYFSQKTYCNIRKNLKFISLEMFHNSTLNNFLMVGSVPSKLESIIIHFHK